MQFNVEAMRSNGWIEAKPSDIRDEYGDNGLGRLNMYTE